MTIEEIVNYWDQRYEAMIEIKMEELLRSEILKEEKEMDKGGEGR